MLKFSFKKQDDMNQENMLMGFLQGRFAKEDLEVKGIKVDPQFELRQALIAAIIENPWLLLLLLQREIRQLDNKAINPAAQAKVVEVWNALKSDLCAISSVSLDDTTCQITLSVGAETRWIKESGLVANNADNKQSLIDFFRNYFTKYSGIPVEEFDNKCPVINTID